MADQMFRFWYRFVFPNLNTIMMGKGEDIFREVIEPELSSYMGPVFEEMAAQYLWHLEDAPFTFQKVGRWWGSNPLKKRQEEIELLAFRD